MNTLKRILIVIPFLCGIVYAQKGNWTVGIATGIRGEVCFSSDYDRNFWSGREISTPPTTLFFGYNIAEHFQIESGLSYVEHKASYGVGTLEWGLGNMRGEQFSLYSALQIPVHFKYMLPLGKSKFNFFVQAGLDLSIPLQKKRSMSFMTDFFEEEWNYVSNGDSIYEHITYITGGGSPNHSLNLLINAGCGFSYRFSFGLGLSVSAEYYSGVTDMSRIRITFFREGSRYLDSYKENPQYIVYRGDYWNVGFAVSYTFKKKEKKTAETIL
jgi:hypothetical protein